MTKLELLRGVVHWSLTAVIAIYIISGFGITEFRIVEAWTFGLITKNLSFIVHNILTVPFIVLLIRHISLALTLKSRAARK
ncbi:MAG: hypothetical protein Q8O05_04830 [Chloroflexota bacterium]|nr:hypothetical protein [Chloroflexota bacterium]